MLLQEEVENIVAQRDAEALVRAERGEERLRTGDIGGGTRHRKKCDKAGRNKCTCKKDAAGVED